MNELNIVEILTFYGFSTLITLFAIMTIFAKKVLYSLIFAMMVFFCAGGLFFSLNADFNAVVQIALYGVAVPVLVLFAIMFTSEYENNQSFINFSPKFFITVVSSSILFMVLWYIVEYSIHLNKNLLSFFIQQKITAGNFNSVVLIANTLYTDYRLAFIMLAVLLFVVVVGISALNVIKERKRG